MYSLTNYKKINIDEKKQSFEVQYFIRKSKKNGYATIYCHISVNQKRTKSPFSTHLRIPQKNWNAESKIINGDGYDIENNELNRIKLALYEIFLRMVNDNTNFDAEYLKKLYLSNQSTIKIKAGISIKEICKIHYISYVNNKAYAEGTIKRVKIYNKRIAEFFGNKEAEKLEVSQLDNFRVFLKSNYNNSHNVTLRNVEFLKAALDAAYKKGLISFVPCYDYKKKRKRTGRKSYLTKQEINLLINANFKNSNLIRIRDVFIFCCYTGFDFSSYLSFSKDNIKNKNGNKYIEYSRFKSDIVGLLPFLPMAEKILIKYRYRLPVFVNQNLNKYIKEVCYLAGIEENKSNLISTHSARVTAGMIWLNEGIRIEVVSRMLGHASIETTQRYYAEIELDTILRETRILSN